MLQGSGVEEDLYITMEGWYFAFDEQLMMWCLNILAHDVDLSDDGVRQVDYDSDLCSLRLIGAQDSFEIWDVVIASWVVGWDDTYTFLQDLCYNLVEDNCEKRCKVGWWWDTF